MTTEKETKVMDSSISLEIPKELQPISVLGENAENAFTSTTYYRCLTQLIFHLKTNGDNGMSVPMQPCGVL